jgi:hypothetical protein
VVQEFRPDRPAHKRCRRIAGAHILAANADRAVINSAGAIRGSRERGAQSTPPPGRIRRRTRCRRRVPATGAPFRRSCERPPRRECASDRPEDDGRGLCRAGQRLVAKTPIELGHEVAQLIIRQLRDVAAQQSKSLSRLRETGSIDRVRFAIDAVDLARVGADRGPDLAGHDDRAFDVRRVDPQIRDQRLGEPLDREFRGPNRRCVGCVARPRPKSR